MTDETPVEGQSTPVEAPADGGAIAPTGAPANTGGDAPKDGQGKDGGATPVNPLLDLATKKGWAPETASEQLLKSYTELESKLGNYKQVQDAALKYKEISSTLPDLQQKALAWDAAQKYINSVDETTGKPDLTRLETKDLASLWQSGQIGLNDIPAERQYEVQSHVTNMANATDRALSEQAQSILTSNPWLNENPDAVEFIATKIEQGVEPGKAIEQVKNIMKNAENKALAKSEEKRKADLELARNGSLESGSSPSGTRPSVEIKNVRDAFNAAKAELGMV